MGTANTDVNLAKKLENAMDFAARNLADKQGRQHCEPGAYQGGFLNKKTTHGSFSIAFTSIESARDKGRDQWSANLIDSKSYFDTFHPMTLQNNMNEFGFQIKIRLAQASK